MPTAWRKTPAQVFSIEILTNILDFFFCKLMFLKSTSATKKFSFDLGYLNIFGANTVNRLLTALCGGPRQSAVTKLIQNFTGNQKQSSVKISFLVNFTNFPRKHGIPFL